MIKVARTGKKLTGIFVILCYISGHNVLYWQKELLICRVADYLTDAFIRLRQRLKLVSGRILSDAGGAEDVLQDAFVRLWRRQYPLESERRPRR